MPTTMTSIPPILRRHTAPDADKITKKSLPRNTKAWTLEHERALLQGRLERVPYKQIGARIGKTDLACRLHFHQMVTAKRTPQTPPERSIVFLSSEHPPEVHRLAPSNQTPIDSAILPSVRGLSSSPANDSTRYDQRPYGDSIHRRSYSSSYADRDRYPTWQPVASPYTNPRNERQTPETVDLSRLNNIYKQHANDFWSAIATKYSDRESLSPSQLEQAFLQHSHSTDESTLDLPRIILATSKPPTTPRSPSSPRSQSQATLHLDTKMNHGPRHSRSISDTTIAGRCSVEALLNHGRI